MIKAIVNRWPFTFANFSFLFFAASIFFALPSPVNASFGFKFDGTLDKTAISKSYFEGDFHRILPPLEAWRTSRATKTREDSIFVYKYLSVIYAADSSTRNKGESYMVQLLKLMPTIELVDMYISDNIEAIFKNVQEKYMRQQKYVRNHDGLGQVLEDSGTIEKKPQANMETGKSNHAWVWWTLGGVGTAAIATTAYFVLSEDKSDTRSTDFKP